MTSEQLAQAIANDSLKQGMDLLRVNKYKAALGHFQAAVKSAPKDSRGWMMLGMTLNRLGFFGNSSVALRRSKALGMKAPQLDFELGWAALYVGAFKAAITHLEAYEKAKPGNAKTSEFMGRAYARLKQFDKAEKLLKQAIKRDPKVKPSANLYLSRIYAARNDQKAAANFLNQIMAQSPNSPVGKLLRDRAANIQSVRKQSQRRKPWFVSLSVSGGHNDNVIGLPEGAIIPADISTKASNFARTTLDAGYSWRLSNISQVNVGYGLHADTYADIDGFDSQAHSLYAEYQRLIRKDLIGSFRVSGNYQLTGLNATRNQIGFRPSVNYRWNNKHSTEASYSVGINNYYATVFRNVLNRDSTSHTLGARHTIKKLSRLDIDTTIGYFYTGNDADGADYDYDANTFLLAMSREIPWKIRAGFSFTHSLTRYDNPNSLSGAGFGYKRRDKLNSVAVGLSRPVQVFDLSDVTVFGQYNYTDNDSNVAEFKYKQNAFNIGVSKRF